MNYYAVMECQCVKVFITCVFIDSCHRTRRVWSNLSLSKLEKSSKLLVSK